MKFKMSNNAFLEIALSLETNQKPIIPLKILSQIEQLTANNPVNNIYYQEISQCSEYLANNFYSTIPHDIHIQVNTPTLSNKLLRMSLVGLSLFDKNFNNYRKKYAKFIHPRECFASMEDYKIVIGTPNLEDKSSSFIKTLASYNSPKEIAQLVFFHEIGHFLENKFLDPKNIKNELSSNTLYDFNIALKDLLKRSEKVNLNPETLKVDIELVKLLIEYQREAYADICSVLLKRNYDIENDLSFQSVEKLESSLKNTIKSLVEARKAEQEECVKNIIDYEIEINIKSQYFTTGLLLQSMDHMTSPALKTLESIEYIYEKKIFNEEEINNIACYCASHAMKKILYIFGKTDNEMKKTINILFSNENYIDNELGKNLSSQWLEKVNTVLNNKENDADKKIKAIIDIGLKEKAFNTTSTHKNDIKEHKEIRALHKVG